MLSNKGGMNERRWGGGWETMWITWRQSVSGRDKSAKALRQEGVWCVPEITVRVATFD